MQCRPAEQTVEAAHQAGHDDSCHTHQQARTRQAVGTEGRHGAVARGDVHGLHHQQVVVERDDGVDQRQKHHQPVSGMEGRGKHEELREESGKGRDARQREERERHAEGQARIGLVESRIGGAAGLAARVLLDGADDAEHRKVGRYVDNHVIDQRGHALAAARQRAKHNVARLRDAAVGHEALQVGLQYGKHVAHRDGKHGDDTQQQAPVVHHAAEHLEQHGGHGKGGRPLRNDRQVARHRGGGALVYVGGPHVEGHEAHLEAQAGEEEDHRHDLQRGARKKGGHVGEIHRAACAVKQRQPVEHQSRREHGAENELRPGLGTVVAVLVERHQAGHRNAGQLKADVEQHEAARAHHQKHAQKRAQRKQIEFARLAARVLAAEPLARLHEHKQRARRKHGLDHRGQLRTAVHAAKGLSLRGNDVKRQLHRHQDTAQYLKLPVPRLPYNQVGQKHDDQYDGQTCFGLHGK